MDSLRDFPFPEPDLAKPDLQKGGLYAGKPPIVFKKPDDFVIQMKYDGLRAVLGISRKSKTGKDYVFVSRQNNVFTSPSLNHLREFRGSSADPFPPNVVLDGEVYSDAVGPGQPFEDFNELSGVCRRGSAYDARAPLLYYVIFDAYFPDEPDLVYSERMQRILKYANRMSPADQKLFQVVKPVSARKLKLPRGTSITDTLEASLEYAENEGFEGIMLRNLRLPYMAGRAGSSLYKLKSFQDEEFKIVGWEEATKKDAGTPVWICETKDGETFNARPMGTLESRRKMWENRKDYLGKDLTVKFQGKSKAGVPRFPVGVTVRDYE